MLSVGHLRLTQYYKNNVGSIHDHHTGIPENQEAKAYTVKNSNWIVQKSNQSILKEINPEYSLEELTLKLKFQFFGHLMRRADSLEKTLMLGKIVGRRIRGRQRVRWLDGITYSWWTWVWVSSGSDDGQGGLECCSLWGHKSWTWLSDWTEQVLQWLRLHAVNVGGLGSIPGQGTRSHMLQLRVHMPQITACCG